MRDIRAAIETGRFAEFDRAFRARLAAGEAAATE
jgi:queuine/archaeosine tRNA-ribosyltransferase